MKTDLIKKMFNNLKNNVLIDMEDCTNMNIKPSEINKFIPATSILKKLEE